MAGSTEECEIDFRTGPDSSVICRLRGAMDFGNATQLRHRIGEVLHPDLDLVFDLSQVEYVDAVGASALVGSTRRVRAIGGRARVSKVNPRIRWVLELIDVYGYLSVPAEQKRTHAA